MLIVKLDGMIEVPTMTGTESKVAVVDVAGRRYALLQRDGKDRAWSGNENENAVDCRLVPDFIGADGRPVFNEIFEAVVPSTVRDTKGRLIGYLVGFYDNGVDFYAYVQNARQVKRKGEFVFESFGVSQRARKFASQDAATKWAYPTAKARIANLAGK